MQKKMLPCLALVGIGCWVTRAVAAVSCLPSPIPISVGNVTLSNGNIAWGAQISVGTPPQNFAFMPQWPLNNLMVYGSNGKCQDDSNYNTESCTTFRGGSYKNLDSTTCRSSPPDAHPDEGARYPADKSFYTDTVRLNADAALADFPLFVPGSNYGEQRYTPLMAVGLGNASTVLGTLRRAGRIGSRTWSLFAGLTGGAAANQLDGSLVFGGYDRAKVRVASRVTAPLTDDNPACDTRMLVTVANITMNFVNGTDVGLLEPGDQFPACVNPSAPRVMGLDYEYVNRFLRYSSDMVESEMDRSTGIHYWNLRYPAGKDPYTGDLTITLESGLQIRINNELLVTPNTDIDAATGATYANATGPDLLLLSLQGVNRGNLATLDYHFFQKAYVSVNQDAGVFSLWEASPSRQTDLVALDEAGAEVTSFCVGGGAGDKGGGGDGAAAGLAPGAIAGVAVGAAGAVAIVVVGGLVFFRRRRRRRRGGHAGADLDPDAATAQPEKPPDAKHETSDPALFGTHEVQGHPVARVSRSELA